MKKYLNHIIILIGANLTGILNLILSIAVLKLTTDSEFSVYTAYTAYFLIFSSISKIVKAFSTSYGDIFFRKIKESALDSNKFLAQFFIFVVIVAYIISRSTGGDYVSGLFVIITAGFNIAILSIIGVYQNRKNFLFSSVTLLVQNIAKLVLAILLLTYFSQPGFWGAYAITSLLTLIYLLKKFRLSATTTDTKIDVQDILVNILLFASLEVLFYIDGIIIQKVLPPGELAVYNSLIIIKKSMLLSLLGIVQIVLANVRKTIKPNLKLLVQNLGITFILGILALTGLYILRAPILKFFDAGAIDTILYVKSIVSAILFTLVLITAYWFSSFRTKTPRIILLVAIILSVIYYMFSITSFSTAINTFIQINVGLLVVEFGIILGSKLRIT